MKANKVCVCLCVRLSCDISNLLPHYWVCVCACAVPADDRLSCLCAAVRGSVQSCVGWRTAAGRFLHSGAGEVPRCRTPVRWWRSDDLHSGRCCHFSGESQSQPGDPPNSEQKPQSPPSLMWPFTLSSNDQICQVPGLVSPKCPMMMKMMMMR